MWGLLAQLLTQMGIMRLAELAKCWGGVISQALQEAAAAGGARPTAEPGPAGGGSLVAWALHQS